MKLLDITEDIRTGRLLRVVTALTLTEDLEPKTRRNLVDQARAVRLLTEAGERKLALSTVEHIVTAIKGDPELKEWHEPISRAGASLVQVLA